MNYLKYGLIACLCLPAAASAVDGFIRIDGRDYLIEISSLTHWNHSAKRLDLTTTSLGTCQRPNGDPPLPGPITVRYGVGPLELYAADPIQMQAGTPQIRVTSVSGDLVCAGAIQPLFGDGFE
ncbi:hypothetical protein C7S18_00970 [Ahniella affigens]|uniref:Uncharacterized protein n=1 Tax=Ahniella affigens TaxID=2021234 RepID=A0A2P1PLY9_9GAMM|nr:hypothetical protein [Ahniella affigens]AVP95854.1 hypothetical protein C7S18_00970 [Ahniella affigens]